MGFYPRNTNIDDSAQTDTISVNTTLLNPVRYALGSPVVPDVDRLLTAVTTSSSATTESTTFLAQPDVARNITVTPGGTTTDVPSGDVTITGTDINGEALSEAVTFAANASTVQATTKAFMTVSSVLFPIQDGASATYTVGVGDKLGLPDKLPYNSVIAVHFGGVREATAATVTSSATVLASNTIDLNSASDGSAIVVDYLV